MESSRTTNSIRNSFWGIASQIVNMLFPFLVRSFIIREIGAEYVGLNSLFKSILSMLNMTELGFGSAIIFLMYKPIAERDPQTLRALLKLMRNIYKAVGAIVLVLGCCVYPFLGLLVKNDTGADVNIYLLYTMYLFHTVMSYWMFSYRSTLFSAHQRGDVLSKISLACSSVQYAVQMIILVATKNYYLYLLVFALMIIPQNLLYYAFSKKYYPDLYCAGNASKEHVQALKDKILPLLGHRIGGKVIISIDSMILSAILGVTVLAKYDNYYYIFSSVATLITIVRHSLTASIGNKLYTATKEDAYIVFEKLTFLWIGLVGWCAACLLSLYQPFIRAWVGQEYLYDISTVACFVLYFFCWQFRMMGLTVKDAAGLWEADRLKPYIGMACNLGLSIILVKVTHHITGVLLPTIVIMLFLYFPWEAKVLCKQLFCTDEKKYLRLVFRLILSSAVAIVATYLASSLLPEDSFWGFLIRILLCVIITPLITLIFHKNTVYFQSIMTMVKRVLNKTIRKHRK